MDKILLPVSELTERILQDTATELGRDRQTMDYLKSQVDLRRRPAKDPNWDAQPGIAHPAVVAAFGRATDELQKKVDLAPAVRQIANELISQLRSAGLDATVTMREWSKDGRNWRVFAAQSVGSGDADAQTAAICEVIEQAYPVVDWADAPKVEGSRQIEADTRERAA